MPTISNVLDPKFIEKQNKAFHRMSKKKQRIAIAEDVLLQLKMKTYTATTGVYEHVILSTGRCLQDDDDLQLCLLNGTQECNVCGLGAAFLSLARLGDRVSLDECEHSVLSEIFTADQVDLIEHAFEGWVIDHSDMPNDYTPVKFFQKYPDPTKRMAAIFKNIIKNDGKFVL